MRRFLTVLIVALICIGAGLAPYAPFPTQHKPETVASAPAASPGPQVFQEVDLKKPYFLSLNTIVQVICYTMPKEIEALDPTKLTPEQRAQISVGAGTGTIISHNRVLTAHHVIEGASICGVNGVPLTLTHDEPENDMAVLEGELGNTAITTIACDGFAPDYTYLAFGYALGEDFALDLVHFVKYGETTSLDEKGAGQPNVHAGLFVGSVTPGMSGGPVIGSDGRLYGILLATGQTVSVARSISDTALCTALKPAEKAAPVAAQPTESANTP